MRVLYWCDPQQDGPRTLDRILDVLTALNTRGELPDLSSLAGFQGKDTKGTMEAKE